MLEVAGTNFGRKAEQDERRKKKEYVTLSNVIGCLRDNVIQILTGAEGNTEKFCPEVV